MTSAQFEERVSNTIAIAFRSGRGPPAERNAAYSFFGGSRNVIELNLICRGFA